MLTQLDAHKLRIKFHGEGVSNVEFDLHHLGRIVYKKESTVFCRGDQKEVETSFEHPIAEDATVVISYLDHIEPL